MEEQKKDRAIPLIILLISQIFFAIILATIIFLNTKTDEISDTNYDSQPATTIENLNTQLPDASSIYLGLIERDLLKTIELNSDNFDINNSKAKIRDNSLIEQKFEGINGTYFSMIVDIPNLEQSYQVYALAPNKDDKTPTVMAYDTQYILCLDEYTEKIYPNFKCEDGYSTNIRASIVISYLKYFYFNNFSTSFKNKDFSTIYIYPVDYNINSATKKSYIQQTKEAIKSLGISPDTFQYHIVEQNELDYTIPPEYL